MKDFKHYKLFPTHVFSFKGQEVNDKEMLEYFEKEVKKESGKKSLNWQSSPNLHKNKIFESLVNNIMEATKQACDAIKLDTSYKLEITNMWGNILQQNECHPPHTHSNNVWSGTYYITQSPTQSSIQYFIGQHQSQVLLPRVSEQNLDNGNLIGFPSEKGRGYVFPSWLTHWVPPHPDKEARVSVAWNIILRGEYGHEKDFQYAKI